MGGKYSIAIPGHIYVSFLDRPVPPKTGQEPPAASAAPHRWFLSGAYNWALENVILNKKTDFDEEEIGFQPLDCTTVDPKQWIDSRSVLKNRVKHMRNH